MIFSTTVKRFIVQALLMLSKKIFFLVTDSVGKLAIAPGKVLQPILMFVGKGGSSS